MRNQAMSRLASKRGEVVAIDARKHARTVKPAKIEHVAVNHTIPGYREALECPACLAHVVRYDTATGEWYCRYCGEDGAAGTYWQRLSEAYKEKM